MRPEIKADATLRLGAGAPAERFGEGRRFRTVMSRPSGRVDGQAFRSPVARVFGKQ
jgi:hypothetical protein